MFAFRAKDDLHEVVHSGIPLVVAIDGKLRGVRGKNELEQILGESLGDQVKSKRSFQKRQRFELSAAGLISVVLIYG